jgi:TRIAD3 protein (E3 ubiquitin-protein ligase RNF216)
MEEPDYSKETSPPPQDACFEEVTAVFPDICFNYLQSIAKGLEFISQDVINHILDLEDSGQTYTKRPKQTSKKRKREADDQDDEHKDKMLEVKRRYIDPHRPALPKNSPQVNVM